ncbi:MAG: hypothetical protein KGN84_13315, partial [Acidobacteriota bacterium]|nr:hypothetical protein [Acidobacteriota bacterium]
MRRRQFLSLVPVVAGAQYGPHNRYFARYPFEKWAEDGEQSGIRWSVHVSSAQLSAHQRLTVTVEVQVDPRE